MRVIMHDWGHVPERIGLRRFTREDVEFVYTNYQSCWENSKKKSKCYRGTLPDGRVLQIVVVIPPLPNGSVILKTAYFIDPEDLDEH